MRKMGGSCELAEAEEKGKLAGGGGLLSLEAGSVHEGELTEAEVFRGRPSKPKRIGSVRELTREDLALLEEPRPKLPVVKRLREYHRRIAWMFATGMSIQEVADASGYGYQRAMEFHNDPAFQQLIAELREVVDEGRADVAKEDFILTTKTRSLALAMRWDKLKQAHESGEDVPFRTLDNIIADTSDRTGLGKHSTQTTLNVGLAEALDRAEAAKMKVIEARPKLRRIA